MSLLEIRLGVVGVSVMAYLERGLDEEGGDAGDDSCWATFGLLRLVWSAPTPLSGYRKGASRAGFMGT